MTDQDNTSSAATELWLHSEWNTPASQLRGQMGFGQFEWNLLEDIWRFDVAGQTVLGVTSGDKPMSSAQFMALWYPDDQAALEHLFSEILLGRDTMEVLLGHADGRRFLLCADVYRDLADIPVQLRGMVRPVGPRCEYDQVLLDTLEEQNAVLGHDINNRLTGIIGSAAMLKMGLEEGGTRAEYVRDIEREALLIGRKLKRLNMSINEFIIKSQADNDDF